MVCCVVLCLSMPINVCCCVADDASFSSFMLIFTQLFTFSALFLFLPSFIPCLFVCCLSFYLSLSLSLFLFCLYADLSFIVPPFSLVVRLSESARASNKIIFSSFAEWRNNSIRATQVWVCKPDFLSTERQYFCVFITMQCCYSLLVVLLSLSVIVFVLLFVFWW